MYLFPDIEDSSGALPGLCDQRLSYVVAIILCRNHAGIMFYGGLIFIIFVLGSRFYSSKTIPAGEAVRAYKGHALLLLQ
jgi:hypothetical protein